MDDLTVFCNSFGTCLDNLERVLKRCKQKGIVLNWENYNFMTTFGIVLGLVVSQKELRLTKPKLKSFQNYPH